jgi:tRNA-specific 2-thiouridylase
MVMMSGGVDSSVTAALLRDDGHDVTGVTLKLWGGESDSGCCSVADVEDARRVAAQLDFPHYVFNFSDGFDAKVVAPYAAAYEHGRTPNPCVDCNRTMKFGRALERARQLGFDAVATGHHARVVETREGLAIGRGADAAKDQSYVLYMLDQEQLRRTLLPVGELTKAEVRQRAAALGLRTAAKPESMDVCFITKGGRESFLGSRITRKPGVLVSTDGTELGRHDGIDAFTIGQRRGLAIAVGERRYVTDIAPATGTVTLGAHDDLLRDSVTITDATWTFGDPPDGEVFAQSRAHGEPVPARIEGDSVHFATPQPRVAPGQVVALYAGNIVLGGGIALTD